MTEPQFTDRELSEEELRELRELLGRRLGDEGGAREGGETPR